MKLICKKVVPVIIILIGSISCFAQQPNFEKLDEFLNILSDNDKLMGSMEITKNNDEIYFKSVGYLDAYKEMKNNSKTKFRIGSITKTFTAVMIFQLIDENKLKLDTPLAQYFPDVPNATQIDVSNLLNHSSGLFNITEDQDVLNWMKNPSSQEEMLSRISSHTSDFEPGAKTEYSNTNYILLGYIIETLDERSYAASLQKRIVDKINLKDTFFGRPIDIKNNESRGYYKEDELWKASEETDMSNPGGAGAIVSTPSDLNKFMNALFNGDLMSASSFRIMKSSNDPDICHGLVHAEVDGNEVFASEGGIDGFQSMLVYVPKDKISIALTANALDYSKMRIILSSLAAGYGKPIILPNFEKISLTEEQLQPYEGTYASEKAPFKLFFKVAGNTLLGSQDNINFKELTPTKQHQFTLDALGVILDFFPETGVLKFSQGAQPMIFERL